MKVEHIYRDHRTVKISVFRLKNEAGKSIEYNGIYCRVIDLQEDGVGVEETTQQSAQIILCC